MNKRRTNGRDRLFNNGNINQVMTRALFVLQFVDKVNNLIFGNRSKEQRIRIRVGQVIRETKGWVSIGRMLLARLGPMLMK